MDEFYEKVGASLAAGALIVIGAMKALRQWLRPKPSTELAELGELIDQLREVSEREARTDISRDVNQLVAVSMTQGNQISGLQQDVSRLDEKVNGLDDRVRLIERS